METDLYSMRIVINQLSQEIQHQIFHSKINFNKINFSVFKTNLTPIVLQLGSLKTYKPTVLKTDSKYYDKF